MFGKIRNTNKEQLKTNILYWLCTGFVYSMLFWTLLNSIFAILMVLFWLFFLKKEFDLTSSRTKLMLIFISLYVISILGMIYTSNLNEGKAVLQKQSALLFFPLVFGTSSLFSSQLLKKIITHYIIATALLCITGLSFGFYHLIETGKIESVTGKGILVPGIFNPIILGLYCLLALVFIIFSKTFKQHRFKNWFTGLSIIFSLFIFLLSIRIIIFCWLLIVLFYTWKIFRNNLHKVLFTLGLFILILLSGLFIPSLNRQWKELVDFSKENTIILDKDASLERSWGGKTLRLAIWQCSFDVINKHWLWGVGTGDVQDNLQQAYEDRKFYFASRYNYYNAHNQYLQYGIGFGIPGILLFVLSILYPLYLYTRKTPMVIYILFLLIFAITAFTESVFEVNKGIVWYSFFNSIFAFTYLTHQPDIKL